MTRDRQATQYAFRFLLVGGCLLGAGRPAAAQGGVAFSITTQQLAIVRSLPDAVIHWDGQGVPSSIRSEALGDVNAGGRGLAMHRALSWERRGVVVMDRLAGLYRIRDAEQEFKTERVHTEDDGTRHVRLRQQYRALPVVGGEMIVHFGPHGQPYQVNGRYVPELDISVAPAVTPVQAEEQARRELDVIAQQGDYVMTLAPQLVIYAQQHVPVLAYQLEMQCVGQPQLWRFWIDAQSGRVINRYNKVPSASAAISGYVLTGEGGGYVTVTGDVFGAYYRLKNNDWYVWNMITTNYYASTNAVWTTNLLDRIGMSSAYNISTVLNYWQDRHGRDSFDNTGTQVPVFVLETNALNNAYWFAGGITFFAVDYANYSDLMTLDIMGHEFGHGVIESTADLIYQNESGALNESFADIFGFLTEYYAQADGRAAYPASVDGQSDWYMGEDAALLEPAFRDMRSPTNSALSSPQPSRYGGLYWHNYNADPYTDNGGVHINSGVQNFMFYLLVEGGVGNNNGLAYNLTGVGVTNAGRVAYRALSYLTSSATFTNACTAWHYAALDIDPSLTTAVGNAWAAVGLANPYPRIQTMEVIVNLAEATWSFASAPAAYSGSLGGTGNLSAITVVTGVYVMAFGDMPGYRTPALQTNVVEATNAILFVGNYVPHMGTLSVAVSPPTGGWRLTQYPINYGGRTSGQGNLDAVSVPTGVYVVAFDALTSYRAPSTQTNVVTDGANVTFNGTYARLQVGRDYDGDNRADLVVVDRSTYGWYFALSGSGFAMPTTPAVSFGADGYTPLAADFDGDGRADLALSGTKGDWYFLKSGSGYALSGPSWFGASGYQPSAADFDSDGRADQAVYGTDGYWHIFPSISGTVSSRWFGAAGYVPAPADFDGDGRADLVLYHEFSGNWYILQSASGSWTIQAFGGSGYTPVPGDFGGDGYADLAVYQESSGYWFIRSSANGTTTAVWFGAPGYRAVP